MPNASHAILCALGMCISMVFFGCALREQDEQALVAAAPKQIELNVHIPIPVEPWPLPQE